MQIFLSWSQTPSKDAASAFRAWLPTIIQDCREEDVFMSDQLKKGEEWFAEITGAAETADLGIVFITGENEDSPWINFGSGALYSRLGEKRLCPVLFRLGKADYNGPMKNYQLTSLSERDDVLQLLHTINDSLQRPLTRTLLESEFETKWPALEARLNSIPEAKSRSRKVAVRSTDNKIDEILELLRDLTRHEVSSIEGVVHRYLANEAIRQAPRTGAEKRIRRIRESSLAGNLDFSDAGGETYRPVTDDDIDMLGGDTVYTRGHRRGGRSLRSPPTRCRLS